MVPPLLPSDVFRGPRAPAEFGDVHEGADRISHRHAVDSSPSITKVSRLGHGLDSLLSREREAVIPASEKYAPRK